MADPVTFAISARAGLWTLSRDGKTVTDFSHVDRATHEAVRLARQLEATGQPARVVVETGDGSAIEVDVGPEDVQPPAP